ncbi:MAG: hypothetical protein CMH28_06445 [Micavibrio sp.]|nr:hypothetical protein [Micavibrio sp.]
MSYDDEKREITNLWSFLERASHNGWVRFCSGAFLLGATMASCTAMDNIADSTESHIEPVPDCETETSKTFSMKGNLYQIDCLPK